MAPPTATPPRETPPERASSCIPTGVFAWTVRPSVEVRWAPVPTVAVVVRVSTWMATDAATLADDLPPAAAIPQAMNVLAAGEVASTVIPAPLSVVASPTEAALVMLATLSPTAAPIWASLCWVSSAVPMALAFDVVVLFAVTATAPVTVSWIPPPMDAVVAVVVQFTAIAAATPTPPPELPDLPDAWPLPWVAVLSADGRVPVPVPLVLGLLPLTWSFAVASDFFASSLLPRALAVAWLSLLRVEVAVTVTAPAVPPRARVADVVRRSTTTMATTAPTATLLPAAVASPVVLVASVVCVAETVTVPVALRPVGEVPR